MIEYVIGILEYYGLTADKIGPAVFVGFGGWFLYKSLKAQIGDLRKDLGKDIGGLEKDIGRLEKDLKEDIEKLDGRVSFLDRKISYVDKRVSFIEGSLGMKEKLRKGYLESFSPIRVAEEGMKLLVESKAKEILEANKREILDKILADPKPTNAYDAQEKTRKVIEDMENDPLFLPLKEYAFQKGMSIYTVLDITSVYFRDFVLEELGFKIEDCDGK